MSTLASAETRVVAGIVANGIDLNSDEFVENPYASYAALRRDAPVCRIEALNAWLLTRYADVRSTLLDDKKFQVDYENMQTNRMGAEALQEPFFRFAREFVFFRDRPFHGPLKAFLRPRFNRDKAEALGPKIREIANQTIDDFIADGHGDLIEIYTHQLPLRVISEILGVPPEDRKQMENWVKAYVPVLGFPPLTQTELQTANEATEGFISYFSRAMADRRANPRDDLITDFVVANDAREEPYTETQVVANIILTYIGGQDTQKGQLGNAIVALHRHPEEFAWLKADIPNRIMPALEELMRYDGVPQITARVAVEDTEIGGQAISRGQTVLVSAAAANRDPEIFADPDTLNLRREFTKPSLDFGVGPHACLGVHLAKMVMPIAIETLVNRIPGLEIELDNLRHNRALSKRGYTSIPASW